MASSYFCFPEQLVALLQEGEGGLVLDKAAARFLGFFELDRDLGIHRELADVDGLRDRIETGSEGGEVPVACAQSEKRPFAFFIRNGIELEILVLGEHDHDLDVSTGLPSRSVQMPPSRPMPRPAWAETSPAAKRTAAAMMINRWSGGCSCLPPLNINAIDVPNVVAALPAYLSESRG